MGAVKSVSEGLTTSRQYTTPSNLSGPLEQERLPKSDIPAPKIGQYGPTQAYIVASQIADLRLLVGVAGFEPAASSSRTKRAAKLRHTPPPA